MAYLTEYQYYANEGNTPTDINWGSYQFISLNDIVKNFMLMYTGNDTLLNNISRSRVIFFAKQAIKMLNYDALKQIKVLQLDANDRLNFILPSDYVNFVRISVYENGMLYPMSENVSVMASNEYLQDNSGAILFDESGNILKPENSGMDTDRISQKLKTQFLSDVNSPFYGNYGYEYEGCWYFNLDIGGRYGLQTSTANVNPVYRIDRDRGVIHLSSAAAGKSIVLEYVSDGMEGGDNDLIKVNKLFEQYLYLSIRNHLLSNKLNTQEYIVRRAKKEAMAELRNAELRNNDFSLRALLMPLRAKDQQLK